MTASRPGMGPGRAAAAGGTVAGRPVSVRSGADLLARLLLGLAVLAATVAPAALAGDDIRVKEVATRQVDGSWVLDARVDYDLSPVALEALDNGVPLTFLIHIQVRPEDAWIWTENAVDLQLRYRLRYKPLSERYEVFRLPGHEGPSFVSREAAIAELGDLKGIELGSAGRLDPERDYQVHIKVELDVEELPLPLRPMAYLRPAWKHGSGWTKWPLRP